MRMPLIAYPRIITIDAAAAPPLDRESRASKAAEHCADEWRNAHALALGKGYPAARALRMAAVAYKLAMPKMDTLASIRSAICCIAQGIQLEVFDGRDGSQLLYAAQVALSVMNGGKRK